MDSAVEQVLAQYALRSEAEMKRMRTLDRAEHERVRDEFLLAIGPASGRLINLLAKESRAKSILEIGTSYGYSTLWLAEAARATGGMVVTVEHISEKAAYARDAMARAGLAAFVDFRIGEALQILYRDLRVSSISCSSICGRTSTSHVSISFTRSLLPALW
jgi:predicted O-methyltransferase YrrM